MRDVIILGGTGGMVMLYHALREVYPDIRVAVLDERATTTTLTACKDTLPVITDWDFGPARRFFGLDDTAFRHFLTSYTYPCTKRILVAKALAHGLTAAPTFVSPHTNFVGDIDVGFGGFIAYATYIASDTRVGNYVTMGGAGIGHDVVIGDFCTVASYGQVLGYATLGEGVQVSPGAVVRTGVRVAPWVVIGINAAVVADIDKEGITVGGVPAKELRSRKNN